MLHAQRTRENSDSIVTRIVPIRKKNGFVPKLFATGKVSANKARLTFSSAYVHVVGRVSINNEYTVGHDIR